MTYFLCVGSQQSNANGMYIQNTTSAHFIHLNQGTFKMHLKSYISRKTSCVDERFKYATFLLVVMAFLTKRYLWDALFKNAFLDINIILFNKLQNSILVFDDYTYKNEFSRF